MVSEDWGLKRWHEIQNKKVWFYHLFEFKVAGVLIALKQNLDVTKIMRFLTVSLDKHAILGLKKNKT
jgi:small subunit ribosomal protein S6